MVTWNSRDLTDIALRHLSASVQSTPYRMLIRDNGSTDGTLEAIAAARPDAEVEAGDRNLGFAAAVNRLLKRSTAPYVLLLNSDAWPHDHAIDRMVDAASAHGDRVVVAPRLERGDGGFEHSTWPYPSLKLSLIYALGMQRLIPKTSHERWMLPPAWQHDYSRTVGWAVGAALLIPRRVIDAVGGLDERFFFYGEDVEWCWRVRDAGFDIWFEASAVLDHVGSGSSKALSAGAVAKRKAAASALVMSRRHGPVTGALFRLLEIATAVRIGVIGLVRRDRGTVSWAKNVISAHLRPLAAQARPNR